MPYKHLDITCLITMARHLMEAAVGSEGESGLKLLFLPRSLYEIIFLNNFF